jgi:hypothetical protein
MPGPHRRPAEVYHQQLEAFCRLWCSLEPWKIELLKDGVCGDALDAVVTYLSSDITQGRGPGVRWCYGLAGDPQAFDERLLQHILHHRALGLQPEATGHIGLCCCNRSPETWTAALIAA